MIMVDKEDLGLSLGLNFPAAAEDHRTSQSPSLQLNLMPFLGSSTSPFNFLRKTPDWTHSSSDRSKADGFGVETRSFLKGIDVNRTPATGGEEEEEAGVSSPNSGVSSVSGKRSERGLASDDRDGGERASSRGNNSDEEDGDNCRKKLRLSKEQSAVLEESFKGHHTLNPKQKLALAKRLGLRPRQVEVWFQNRRARTKLKQTEVDHELMKRCCENLREENKRLQKELQELKALKLSPQGYMQMAPPTTLTMCPSCAPSPKGQSGSRHRTLPFTLWANGDVGVHPLS